MTTPTQQLRNRALSSPSVTVGTAQMICALLDIIDKQQAAIDWLQKESIRHSEVAARQSKEIQRLQGVHGA